MKPGRYSFAILAMIAVTGAYYLWASRNSATASGAPMVTVSLPVLGDEAAASKLAFNENCVACHGENAAGREGIGPPLVHAIYRPGHHADVAFELAAMNGVRSHHWTFGSMPPVDGVTEDDVRNITIYIRALQRENGIN